MARPKAPTPATPQHWDLTYAVWSADPSNLTAAREAAKSLLVQQLVTVLTTERPTVQGCASIDFATGYESCLLRVQQFFAGWLPTKPDAPRDISYKGNESELNWKT